MSGWAAGEKCLVKDQDHGWATAVVTGSQGIGSEATLKLRLDDGGVLLEKLGSEVERLTKPEVQWMNMRQAQRSAGARFAALRRRGSRPHIYQR